MSEASGTTRIALVPLGRCKGRFFNAEVIIPLATTKAESRLWISTRKSRPGKRPLGEVDPISLEEALLLFRLVVPMGYFVVQLLLAGITAL